MRRYSRLNKDTIRIRDTCFRQKPCRRHGFFIFGLEN
jgi:hypothetical protein